MITPPGAPRPPAPRPPRPGVVRAAVYVEAGLSVFMLAVALAVVIVAVWWNDLVAQAAQNTSAVPEVVADERFNTLATAVEAGLASLMLALWFGVTAISLWHGAHAARVLTFAVVGAPLLCGPLLLGIEFRLEPDDLEGSAAESYEAFLSELDRLSADGFWPVAILIATACMVIGCLIILAPLLFNPVADRYFQPNGPRRVVQYVFVPCPAHSWPPPAPPGYGPPGPIPPACSAARPAPETPPSPGVDPPA